MSQHAGGMQLSSPSFWGWGCQVQGSKWTETLHFFPLWMGGSSMAHLGPIPTKTTSAKEQGVFSHGNLCSSIIGELLQERKWSKIENLSIDDSYTSWRGNKGCSKPGSYCLHSKKPDLVAFPIGNLSRKGKNSINIVTELPFNALVMVTEHKSTWKEMSRRSEHCHCLCWISSMDKGIESPTCYQHLLLTVVTNRVPCLSVWTRQRAAQSW